MRKQPMFTLGARVLVAGQKFRVDEAPTVTALTVRILAQRQADRQAKRLRFVRRAS